MGSLATEAKKRQKKKQRMRIRASETTKTRKFRNSDFADLTPLSAQEIVLFYVKDE